ncbi:hypothetical protein GmHk_01G000361 [Glycine max]|nr:hypothetical protein GmHk_01G000361 [Glycine max]
MFGMNWIADRHLVSMSKDQNTWKLLEVASDECGLSRLHCVSKHTGNRIMTNINLRSISFK